MTSGRPGPPSTGSGSSSGWVRVDSDSPGQASSNGCGSSPPVGGTGSGPRASASSQSASRSRASRHATSAPSALIRAASASTARRSIRGPAARRSAPPRLEEARGLARAVVELVDRVEPLAGRGLGRLGGRRPVARRAEPAVELVLRGGDLARVGALLGAVEVLAQGVVGTLRLAQRVGGRLRVDARLGRDRAALVHEPARDVAWIGGCRRDRHRPGQLVVGRAAGEAARRVA